MTIAPLPELLLELAGGIGSVVLISVGVGLTAPRWPARWLRRDVGPLRLTRRETREMYEVWGIRRLKRLYPEGGAWAGGEAKSRLPNLADPAAIDRYVVETRRAEWVHWIACLSWLPMCFFAPAYLWLPVAVITLIVNAIPIAIVRYNRLRLTAAAAAAATAVSPDLPAGSPASS